IEINGGTFTNVARDNYNTKHLIAQQRDITRAFYLFEAVPDSLINTIDAAASSECRTRATQLTESNPINAEGAAVNNIARDNYNVKNLSLSYRDSGTSTLSALLNATSPSAAFNSRERHPPPKCHPGTRQAILNETTAWVDLGLGGAHPFRGSGTRTCSPSSAAISPARARSSRRASSSPAPTHTRISAILRRQGKEGTLPPHSDYKVAPDPLVDSGHKEMVAQA
ncbi:hypothetical protein DXG01_000623, partial [Tephrocybe rancida]